MEERVRGRLKIFFGYAPGVGKTYAMLDDAQEQLQNGVDVVAGFVKDLSGDGNSELLGNIPILPRKLLGNTENPRSEFDLDKALKRHPRLIIVDDIAHSNEIGVRNKKRYQDIEELLNSGIDVYTTVNLQNIESLNDMVQLIMHTVETETIPDYIFDHADKVRLIDIEPDELLKRLELGKANRIYDEQNTCINFLNKESLILLRELAMRKAADRISNNNEGNLSDMTTNTKLLVCISSSPSSARIIRWTARTAEAFHAPWVAVYVENRENDRFSEQEKKNFQANVELAEQLGAEITTLHGQDIATTIAGYAKLAGITNIVVGKSRRRKMSFPVLEKDLEDKLISLLSNTEIHIIPDNLSAKKYNVKRKLFSKRNLSFSLVDFSKMLLTIILVTIFSVLLDRLKINHQNIIMFYIVAILIISKVTNGYLYGVIASILSVLINNYLFMEPRYALHLGRSDYPITLLIMLITSLITSATTVRIKSQVQFAEDREQRTEVLYEINKNLLVTRGLDNIIDLTNEYIVKIFGKSAIFYTHDPSDGAEGIIKLSGEQENPSFFYSPEEIEVAHWVFVNQKRAGAGTDTLTSAKAYYMPVIFQGNVLGVLGVACSNGLVFDQSKRAFMRRIASLVAMALERQRLSDEQRTMIVETEKEKMRSNLLRAISHDLRTPLTAILGASSAILENKDSIDPADKQQLLLHIKDDSQWLIRMVENLLSVTRINEDTANVTKTPEAAEEIVGSAISRIRKRFPEQKIVVSVPEELLLVPMDATLIEQVILNLIENAIKHSNETLIEVALIKEDNYAVIEVKDNGEGISEQDFNTLFESGLSTGKRSSDSSRGMGIGLSICKSIIKAHQGKIEASNLEGHGAIFRFSLPLV